MLRILEILIEHTFSFLEGLDGFSFWIITASLLLGAFPYCLFKVYKHSISLTIFSGLVSLLAAVGAYSTGIYIFNFGKSYENINYFNLHILSMTLIVLAMTFVLVSFTSRVIYGFWLRTKKGNA